MFFSFSALNSFVRQKPKIEVQLIFRSIKFHLFTAVQAPKSHQKWPRHKEHGNENRSKTKLNSDTKCEYYFLSVAAVRCPLRVFFASSQSLESLEGKKRFPFFSSSLFFFHFFVFVLIQLARERKNLRRVVSLHFTRMIVRFCGSHENSLNSSLEERKMLSNRMFWSNASALCSITLLRH